MHRLRSLLRLEPLEDRVLLTANGEDVRHYRLAVAATSDYTAFFGGDRAVAQAEIAEIVGEVNLVLGPELNVQLDLIDNVDIIFGGDNPSADPYSADAFSAISENQTLLDSEIGAAGYDVGWVFGTFDGGRARLGGFGVDGMKAEFAAGLPATPFGPEGTRFLDIILHESGHHLGANHTFNSTEGSCGLGGTDGRNAATAFEPGSGTTIMSYAGICPAVATEPPTGDNVQNFADAYFHAGSLEEIVAHLESLDLAGVGTLETGANAVPTIDAGADFTIPAGTPFWLEATAADADDADGDSLRYTIEQMDVGPAQSIDPGSDNGSSPLFRSFAPARGNGEMVGSFMRSFPQQDDLLGGTVTKGELLPSSDRTMTFRATVRDGEGGTDSDDVTITVVDTGSVFRVLSPNTATTLAGGASTTITWDVAGTTGSGIDAALVDIRLSTDGGKTFPYLLATTANDGSQAVTLPNLATSAARIRVEGAGNIFFDVSDADFTITRAAGSPGIEIIESGGSTDVAEGGGVQSASDSYSVALNTVPAAAVEITVTADANAEVSLDGAAFSSTVSFTRSDSSPQTVLVRAIDDAAEEGAHSSRLSHSVTASGDGGYAVGLLLPDVLVRVIDDELVPLIGVDFQGTTESGGVPTNWTQLSETPEVETPTTLFDLIRETGGASGIDLTITPSADSSFSSAAGPLISPTVPLHTQPLSEVDDVLRWRNPTGAVTVMSVDFTWSGLVPGGEYAVYVFASEFNTEMMNQTVTITGSGVDDPLPFTQVSRVDGRDLDRRLFINDEEGRSVRELSSFAKIVTADGSGEIHIDVTRDDGVDRNRLYLSGLAIQEVAATLPSLPSVAFDVGSQSDTEGAGTMTATVSLSEAASTAVSVPFTLGGTATEGAGADYTVSTSPLVIPAGVTSAEITITVNDDSDPEADEAVVLTLGTPSGAVLGTVVEHTATILDNDGFTPRDLNVTLSGGDLKIEDDVAGGRDNLITLTYDDSTAELVISDPASAVGVDTPGAEQVSVSEVRVPMADVSGDVIINSRGGSDLITLVGLNLVSGFSVTVNSGTGSDTLVAGPFSVPIEYNAAQGSDTWRFTGGLARERVTITPSRATVENESNGSVMRTNGVESYEVGDSGGFDLVRLNGESGADSLTAATTHVEMSGSGYSYVVDGASELKAFGNGGADMAMIDGAAGERDNYISRPSDIRIFNRDYDTQVFGFPMTETSGNGGDDKGRLFGAASGDDSFELSPEESRLSGSGYENVIHDFARLFAFADSAGDEAILTGSAGRDEFLAQPITQAGKYEFYSRIRTLGPGYSYTLLEFPSVVVNAAEERDLAYLTGFDDQDDLLTATTRMSVLEGPQYRVTVHEWPEVRVFGGNGSGSDEAILGDVALLTDTLKVRETFPQISNTLGFVNAFEFESVTAETLESVDRVDQRSDVTDYLLTLDGDWVE